MAVHVTIDYSKRGLLHVFLKTSVFFPALPPTHESPQPPGYHPQPDDLLTPSGQHRHFRRPRLRLRFAPKSTRFPVPALLLRPFPCAWPCFCARSPAASICPMCSGLKGFTSPLRHVGRDVPSISWLVAHVHFTLDLGR
jgi:hypothetical protein